MPPKIRRLHADSLHECRNQILILTRKVDALHRECRHDRGKLARIRGIESALLALTEMVDNVCRESRLVPEPDIYMDANGITYQSVRSCDLERICDK